MKLLQNKWLAAGALTALFFFGAVLASCARNKAAAENKPAIAAENNAAENHQNAEKSVLKMPAHHTVPKPVIIDKPILWSERREKLMREYANRHYNKDIISIEPQAVIAHWTVSHDWEPVYNYFYGETMPDDGGGTLNVTSHYLVAKDGTIFQLTPETAMNRHAIGYNWCAIGIENVGGVGGREDLTEAQLQANISLIRYLSDKYPTINYVWGHYQQEAAKASGLHIELVPDYYAGKIDPGPIFMRGLREWLADTRLKFFPE